MSNWKVFSGEEQSLLIVGAGGLGRTVAKSAQMSGRYIKIAFLDDSPTEEKSKQHHIIGSTHDAKRFINEFNYAIPAFGSNEKRYELMQYLKDCGYKIPRIIHPTAYISPTATIGEGAIIRPMAGISREVVIEECCLINMGAMIDHDCHIGQCTHIPMGAVVRGGIHVPAMSDFEPNSVIE